MAVEGAHDGVEVGDQVGVEGALAGDQGVAGGQQVAAAQLDGIDTQPVGGHVHVQLTGQGGLGGAEAPVRRRRGGVGVHRHPPHPQVGHPVGTEAAIDALGEHQRAVVGVGAGVEADVDVAGHDPAVGVEAGAHGDERTVGPGGVHGRLDVGGDPDRAASGPRRGRGQRLQLGVGLRAVAAADVGDLDPHRGQRQREHPGQLLAHHQRVLGGGDHMQGAGLPVGQGVVGLHGVAVDDGELGGGLDHGGGSGEGGLGVAPQQIVAVGDVVGGGGRSHAQELPARLDIALLVDEHVGGEGAGRVGEGGQVVVVDPHQRGRVGGLMLSLGHHHRHRLAVIADLAFGQDGVIGNYVAEAAAEFAEVVGGDHGDHPGRGLGVGPVDAGDVSVGPLGAHYRGVGHVRDRRVDGVASPAGDLLPGVAPGRGLAGHWSSSGDPARIREAATVTAVSMGA